jgi:hypothetical protein
MKTNIFCLKLKSYSLFLCMILCISLLFVYNGLYASEVKSEKNKLITVKDEKIIKELVIWYVEDSITYWFTASNATQLRSRIEECCMDPLAEEIYNSTLPYLDRETGFSVLKVKYLKLSQREKDIEVFVKYDEHGEDGSESQGTAIFNLKLTKNGWRIYKRKFNSSKGPRNPIFINSHLAPEQLESWIV